MLKNYIPIERKEETFYRRDFQRIGEPDGCGFSFESDRYGNLTGRIEAQNENFRFVQSHPEMFRDLGAVLHRCSYTEPAHGTCECGEEVFLFDQYMGACECHGCGRWYNLFGYELLPPDDWEEYADEL